MGRGRQRGVVKGASAGARRRCAQQAPENQRHHQAAAQHQHQTLSRDDIDISSVNISVKRRVA